MTHPERAEEIRARLAKSMLVEHRYDYTPETCSACGCTRSIIERMGWTCRVDPAAERDFLAHAREDMPHLLSLLTASEKRAETARDDALEEAAKVAAAHDADQGIKKLGPSNFRMASEEARMAMRDEARGERIASEMIAKAIRAMKGQC